MKKITKYAGDSGKEYESKYDALIDDCRTYADHIAKEFANITSENEAAYTRRLLDGLSKQPRKAYRRLLRLRTLAQAAQLEADEPPF